MEGFSRKIAEQDERFGSEKKPRKRGGGADGGNAPAVGSAGVDREKEDFVALLCDDLDDVQGKVV